MKCDDCGKDVGQDGVLTVLLSRREDGSIDSIPWRRCKDCTTSSKETERDGDTDQ